MATTDVRDEEPRMKTIDVHGVTVPALGFGTWELEGETAYRPVRDALEVGYRHIDTAQMYGNEQHVGRAIADSGVDRDDVFLTTKVWKDAAAHDDVISSHEDSLRRLGTDHVDLLLVHWPSDAAPVEETVRALDELRQQGKTRLIGVSNYPSDLLRRAIDAAPVATNQVEYHTYLTQDPVLGPLREHDLMLTAYSPLAHGKVIDDPVLTEIGEAHSRTAAQVALRWLLDQPGVAAIPRSTNREHIAANFDVFDFELSDDETKRIDALDKHDRQIDPPFAPDWD